MFSLLIDNCAWELVSLLKLTDALGLRTADESTRDGRNEAHI